MIETGDGVYLIDTSRGLVRFDSRAGGERFTPVDSGDHGPSRVTALFVDRAGRVWAAGDGDLYRIVLEEGPPRFERQGFEPAPPGGRLPPDSSALLESSAGGLWIAHTSGLYRWSPDGTTERFTVEQGLPSDHVTSLAADRTGTLWIGTTAGLARLRESPDGSAPSIVPVDLASLRVWIFAIVESGDGRLWISSRRGVTVLDPRSGPAFDGARLFTSAHGLSRDHVTALADDGRGNLWLGTASAGVKRLSFRGLVSYAETEGLSSRRVAAIVESRDGPVCAYTPDAVEPLNCVDGERVRAFRPAIAESVTNLGWGWRQVLLQDHAGEWWLATGEGLLRFPAVGDVRELARTPPKVHYTRSDGLPADYLFRIFEDSEGDIWVGTVGSEMPHLGRWDRSEDRFQNYLPSVGIPAEAPTAFVEDGLRSVWIGFYHGGVARFRDGRFEYFGPDRGCPRGFVRALHRDLQGRIWIATSQDGVARIDDPAAREPEFVNYGVDQGLSSNLVSAITEDEWGRIYLGTSRGVDRLDPQTGIVRHFSTADGLPNSFVNVAHRDREGALWFGTLGGLARLTPRRDEPLPSPAVFISGVNTAGRPAQVSDVGESEVRLRDLPAGTSPIEIEYVAPGENLVYRYKLEGAGDNWSAPTRQRTVHYASLAPGRYRFLVKAINADGVESERPAAVAIVIPRPVWQRGWFVGFAVLLLAGSGVVAYRYRVASLRRREAELARQVAEKTRDLLEAKSQLEESNRTLEDRVERGIDALRGAERMAAYGRLVAGVAHEVRHPIFSLQAAAYVLGDKLREREDLATQLRILNRETRRMTALMDDLLEFARPQELSHEDADPAALLREAEETFRSAGGEPAPEVEVNPDAGLPSVRVDRRRMLQVFVNLMENARKHARGITRIGLTAEFSAPSGESGARIVFRVANDGGAIPEERRAHLFEPFYTSGRGTGLGLAIVRRIVADHGGRIEFETEENRGTVFTITIPTEGGAKG